MHRRYCIYLKKWAVYLIIPHKAIYMPPLPLSLSVCLTLNPITLDSQVSGPALAVLQHARRFWLWQKSTRLPFLLHSGCRLKVILFLFQIGLKGLCPWKPVRAVSIYLSGGHTVPTHRHTPRRTHTHTQAGASGLPPPPPVPGPPVRPCRASQSGSHRHGDTTAAGSDSSLWEKGGSSTQWTRLLRKAPRGDFPREFSRRSNKFIRNVSSRLPFERTDKRHDPAMWTGPGFPAKRASVLW